MLRVKEVPLFTAAAKHNTILIFSSQPVNEVYNSFKLLPEQWNLQRFLFQLDLDPSNPVLEGVIMTLIYGVGSASIQSETGTKKLGVHVEDSHPAVKELVDDKRFCDDLGDSKVTSKECKELSKSADEVFAMVGLKCKTWNYSGEPPSEKST